MKRGSKFVVAAAAAVAVLLLSESPLHQPAAAATTEEGPEELGSVESVQPAEVEGGNEALEGVEEEDLADDEGAAAQGREAEAADSSDLPNSEAQKKRPSSLEGNSLSQNSEDQAPSSPELASLGTAAGDVDADPRLGRCTAEELSAMANFFADGSACPAYRCIDTETARYAEAIQAKYPNRFEAEEVASLSGMMAACHCRCPVMKCEIDYVSASGSSSCREATVDFCRQSNEKFTEKCTAVAAQLPLVYDLEKDPQAFKSFCQVCEPSAPTPVASSRKREAPSDSAQVEATAAGQSTDEEKEESRGEVAQFSLFLGFTLCAAISLLG